jgi:hypothetical protein
MKTKPHEASGHALAALIEYAQQNIGTVKRIAEALTALTGQTVYRQYVGLWLHPVPGKRVEPPLGMGLLLIQEGYRLAKGRAFRFDILKALRKNETRKTKNVQKRGKKSRK